MFSIERLLDEDSFLNALKDQETGRATNLSLYDEIRLSYCKNPTHDLSDEFPYRNQTKCSIGTQTLDLSANESNCNNNNDNGFCEDYRNNSPIECLECNKLNAYIEKLECQLKHADRTIKTMESEIDRQENNLATLERFMSEGYRKNDCLQTIVETLNKKLDSLQDAFKNNSSHNKCSVQSQTGCGNCIAFVICSVVLVLFL